MLGVGVCLFLHSFVASEFAENEVLVSVTLVLFDKQVVDCRDGVVFVVLDLGRYAAVLLTLHYAFHFNDNLVQNGNVVFPYDDAIELGLTQLGVPRMLHYVLHFIARLGIR